ncbi:PP2C family protein-serine/threonine phosphatase [Streptomyces sp. NPDC018031]|uniref:PP2C family protein-serine/threonine phosphatase n=1 Tax=Streptomyces sp. NPDC018031 TaxID=3365033 RepID=UPI0037A91CC3
MEPGDEPPRHDPPGVRPGPDTPPDEAAGPMADLVHARDRLQALLDAVLAISRELDLPTVLHRIVTTAMDLVGARYGALGVLDESGTELAQFITAGLSEGERGALAGIDFPHGRGVLGHLIRHPQPLRVENIPAHPASVGFPPGHPHMRTLLGAAITVRGQIYGDLYLSERYDGKPFDAQDEEILVALAGAAGIAVANARLYQQVHSGAEHFQRLLLPILPDMRPFEAAAVYRPAAQPHHLGGDWYDAMLLPDGSWAAVIGDVVGHDLNAAAAMAQTRNMLRALLYDRCSPPSAVLHQLDRTLHAVTDVPVTTACLARIEAAPAGAPGAPWTLHWSSAGHHPPLLLTPDGTAEFLHGDPGLPLGVLVEEFRPDHRHPVPAGSTIVLFTDGLVEHPAHPLDASLEALAGLAAARAGLPLEDFVTELADRHPSDGHDDLALLAVRVPGAERPAPAG